MTIPFLDIRAQNSPLRAEIRSAIDEVIEEAAFAGGRYVEKFEEDFASFCQCKRALGMGSGTEALWLALLGSGVGPGDEVITVPSTFMATAEAITYSGARPVFVDIDRRTYTMDPTALESAITSRTKAIIPVHLFGQPADMDPIMEVARSHGLIVIEDACQAHGATYKGRQAGTLGNAGCFSFYPGKNLGAFGEAGAVVTNDTELAERMSVLRDHGQVRKYHHTMVGGICRMDGIQGAVLRIKLKQLEKGNQQRRQLARAYDEAFAGVREVITPWVSSSVKHVYHLFAIRVRERDALIESLASKGIGTGIHYPIPVHLQIAYRSLGYAQGAFPVAEQCAREFVSLPMYPELPVSKVVLIADAVKSALGVSIPAQVP
jgi:dTDP-4-amino-4,6-dideoxygalactose transaminase